MWSSKPAGRSSPPLRWFDSIAAPSQPGELALGGLAGAGTGTAIQDYGEAIFERQGAIFERQDLSSAGARGCRRPASERLVGRLLSSAATSSSGASALCAARRSGPGLAPQVSGARLLGDGFSAPYGVVPSCTVTFPDGAVVPLKPGRRKTGPVDTWAEARRSSQEQLPTLCPALGHWARRCLPQREGCSGI